MSQEREKNYVGELISSLKQQRDELVLQIHLAEMEGKEEFEKAQKKLDQVSSDFEPLKDAVEESAENVWESLKLVAGEVKDSFDRIRKAL
jgi:hypothetical protein